MINSSVKKEQHFASLTYDLLLYVLQSITITHAQIVKVIVFHLNLVNHCLK